MLSLLLTYSLSFSYPCAGIKMGARILVNGQQIGTATDQFLRYVFALPVALLRAGESMIGWIGKLGVVAALRLRCAQRALCCCSI